MEASEEAESSVQPVKAVQVWLWQPPLCRCSSGYTDPSRVSLGVRLLHFLQRFTSISSIPHIIHSKLALLGTLFRVFFHFPVLIGYVSIAIFGHELVACSLNAFFVESTQGANYRFTWFYLILHLRRVCTPGLI